MNTLKLSVVLCTYNGTAFLRPQLDSLLAQSRLPDEVIVSDDGSTDETWPILRGFADRASMRGIHVKLEQRGENVGYVANFSCALKAAKGDVLLLCDQDDIWRNDKLEIIERRFELDDTLLLVCSDAQLVDERSAPLGYTLFKALELTGDEQASLVKGRAFDVLLRRSMVTGATAAFRRKLLEVALPVAAGWIHDEWLAVVAASLGKVDAINELLIDYRQHGNNQIGVQKRGLAEKWRDLVRRRRLQFRAEVLRLNALLEHLQRLYPKVPQERLDQVREKRDHLANRAELGARSLFGRIPMILEEARQGRYNRYGTGARSMLRDLLRRD